MIRWWLGLRVYKQLPFFKVHCLIFHVSFSWPDDDLPPLGLRVYKQLPFFKVHCLIFHVSFSWPDDDFPPLGLRVYKQLPFFKVHCLIFHISFSWTSIRTSITMLSPLYYHFSSVRTTLFRHQETSNCLLSEDRAIKWDDTWK